MLRAEAPLLEGHVCRHKDGSWNGVSSDQFGEQTYIRCGKGKGDLIGNQEQVTGWLFAYPVCSTVSVATDTAFDECGEIEER